MQLNGHRGPVPGPDHTSILVHIAERVGEIGADVKEVRRRVSMLERAKPRSEWSTPVLCSLLLAAAAGGKITWSEALPTMLGLFAR